MKRYLSIIILFLCMQAGFAPGLYAQDNTGKSTITVQDQHGEPVRGATVWYNEGALLLKTDEAGQVRIALDKAGAGLRIEAPGYETSLLRVDSIAERKHVIVMLNKPLFQTGQPNLVQLPFAQLEKRRIVGAVTQLDPEKILQYDNSQDVLGAIGGRVAGLYNNRNVRGLGAAIVVIDGIPRSAPDNASRLNMVDDLDLLDVKNITVLKDATSKMLYGAKAGQGVILITTKRGAPYKRELKVYAEAGLKNPVSYPDYLAASDYMILYNEALANDGLAPKYSREDIENTYNGTDRLRYPDESFYNDTYLKPNTTFYNVVTEASGGNETARYFASLGFNRNGSIFESHGGEGAFAQDHLSFRGNVDFRVNSWISASLDASAFYNYNRYPNGYYGDDYSGTLFDFAAAQLPNSFPTLIPVDQLHDSMLLKSAKLVDGQYLLGGTNQFGNNILGNLVFGGVQSTQQKSIQFNAGLKFNLDAVLQGLTGNAAFTYDFLNSYTLRQNNTYAVYEPAYVPSSSGADSLVVTQYGTDLKRNDQTVNGNYFQRRYGLYGTLHYQRIFDGVHRINATALAYMSAYSTGRTSASSFDKNRNQHFGLRANYMYNNKYVAEFDGVYVGSSFLSKRNRYAFSPSAGLAWIISEEPFFQDNGLTDYLKLKASYGIVNSDDAYNAYRLYNTIYTRGGKFDYDNASGNTNEVTQFASIGNPDLGFVKQKEFNAGFESSLFHHRIWLEASYFNITSTGIPVIRSSAYPAYLGGFIPTENYNENRNSGVEASLRYKNNTSALRYTVGFNMVYAVPRALKVDEVEHAYPYQYRQGRVSDAMFGYVAEGLFQDKTDIADHAVQSFGAVQPGDIKYKDLNNDGVINDDDRMQIGNSFPRFQYGLNITLAYRNFELFAIGTAQTGSDVIYNNSYYWVFGDRKYSSLVLGRWTPATASTATYPRLTTTSGSNNFRNSTYWLYKNDYFTLNRAQLTYHLPAFSFWKGLQLYVRGNNLLTISPTRKQRELNIASAPQMRSYAVGIIGSF